MGRIVDAIEIGEVVYRVFSALRNVIPYYEFDNIARGETGEKRTVGLRPSLIKMRI